ncbi:hypothetical protein OSSY52_10900 [Tepiditoga spiralis]|uniref:HD-GYP domain-containing protein n=1 Tax=Tepiditoga spiralis TaxID=2108365 RepID=A0A7G1GBB4_9BACT|nr:HD domain-containing phosphohydrolase [Tepiditoga spiralis]BBE30949.1 hypothetical protein OSSY52_10900 [Tepiditoga spiralis]
MIKKLIIFLIILVNLINFSSIKVGIYQNPPLSIINDNKIYGIFPELLNYIAKKENLDIEYITGTFSTLYTKLKENNINLLMPIAYNEERTNEIDYNNETIVSNWGVVITQKKNNILSIKDLNKKVVAVLKGDVYYNSNNGIKNLSKKFNINPYFIEKNTYYSIEKAVSNGSADAGVVNRYYLSYEVEDNSVLETNIIFDPYEIKIGFSKKFSKKNEIINIIDQNLYFMKENPNSNYYSILKKYENPNSKKISKLLYFIIIFSVLSFSFFTIVIILLKKIIVMKTKKLEKSLVIIQEQKEEIENSFEELQANNEELIKNHKELEKLNKVLEENQSELVEKYIELNTLNGELKKISEKERFQSTKFKNLILISSKFSTYLENDSEDDFLDTIFHSAKKILSSKFGLIYKINFNSIKILHNDGYSYDSSIPKSFLLNDAKIQLFDKNSIFSEFFIEESINSIISIPLFLKKKKIGGMFFSLSTEKNDDSSEIIDISLAIKELTEAFLSIKSNNDTFKVAYNNFAKKLAIVAEAYDENTGNHIERVGILSSFISEKLGMPKSFVKDIRNFAPLHDIGKIFIPNEILNKPGKLTEEEWNIMQKHTMYSIRLIGEDEYFKMALNIALYHHEKFDGSGYPFKLSGNEIPIEASIVSIVDVYDALRSKRSYKPPYNHKKALDIIINGDNRTNSKHFNPNILKTFLSIESDIETLYNEIYNTDENL